MYWADDIAQQLKKRNLPLEWVDDMKTPSGRVHVGALRGVIVHDLAYKALKNAEVNAKYTYVFENHDPMDDIPVYLDRQEYEKYLGMPLFKIPSPEPGYKDFAEYYALEFQTTFNAIGCNPEIIWTKDLYTSGKMNAGIKKVLDNAEEVRKIYGEMYKKELPSDWFPFQVYCEQCGKVSTTRVYKWDGESVYYRCQVDATDWTKGCGYEGKTSPFSNEKGMKGKLPWKVEWPVKWQAIGVTVEGAGKDHMSRGGSHDLAKLICERVINYTVPYPIPYEFFLIGGKKMSSSKGRGYAASDMLTILPPELLRFLMVKTDINQAINFDPSETEIIPRLFDEYQEYADHYFSKKGDDYARIFELSQIQEVKQPPKVKFSTLTQWVQMPNMEAEIEKAGAQKWVQYAKVWVERFAPESEKFAVSEDVPEQVKNLSAEQKKFLGELAGQFTKSLSADETQSLLFDLVGRSGLKPKEAFQAMYVSLLGKTFGPKAGAFLASLDHTFVEKRLKEASQL